MYEGKKIKEQLQRLLLWQAGWIGQIWPVHLLGWRPASLENTTWLLILWSLFWKKRHQPDEYDTTLLVLEARLGTVWPCFENLSGFTTNVCLAFCSTLQCHTVWLPEHLWVHGQACWKLEEEAGQTLRHGFYASSSNSVSHLQQSVSGTVSQHCVTFQILDKNEHVHFFKMFNRSCFLNPLELLG